MKTIIKITAFASFLLSSAAGFNSCNDDKEINLNVTPVKQLYEPTDGKSVELESSASAALYFEWEAAKAEDGGMVLYEVAFDRENGDFSNPVYRMASENNGGRNYLTITHKQLNKIAGMIGIGPAETGKLKWTVFSSKGVNEVKAEVARTLEIKRLQGFDEIPVDLYIAGEASEGGATLADAPLFKMVNPGEFEIYTQLTAGKTFYFVDGKTGDARRFYADGVVLKENETGISEIAITGVYKIEVDFNTGGVAY
ncbi:MAG: SusE domain-containing protein, partial [Dysgonamonadaceae bacterium]|nr:SusE domain-containing protein [Dysgonamonadaceae bacterium]